MGQDWRIQFDGAVNFRDAGGYPVAGGGHMNRNLLYRSDSLADLSDADLDRLSALNLYGICDFRTKSERTARPDRLPADHDMVLISPGFLGGGAESMYRRMEAGDISAKELATDLRHHYCEYVTTYLRNYIPFLRLVLEAQGRPVLIHCTSGKDRTGWGVALIHLIAGVAPADIEADYLRTNQGRRDVAFLFAGRIDPGLMEVLTCADPENLAAGLKRLEEDHGAPEHWLAALGFDAADQAELRRLLISPV